MIVGERERQMSFSEKILYLRTRNGMSQEVLADKLSVSRQAVSKWESGVTLPETDKLIAISDMFKVSLDYLLKEDSREHKKGRSTGNLDRVIDAEERKKLDEIMVTLDEITRNIQDIKEKMAETN